MNSFKTINDLIEVEGKQTRLTPDQLWIVRHGETEWSLSGRHTGATDVPLNAVGEHQAKEIGRLLQPHRFALVLKSPLQRARDTCRLAGFGD